MRAIWILGLVVVVLVGTILVFTGRSDSAVGWEKLKGDILSSVAWSPDGKHIAFVSTVIEKPEHEDALIGWPLQASIWILPVGEKPEAPRMLYQVPKEDLENSTPVALFWLSNDELGFATSQEFTFYTIGLDGDKPKRLTDMQFLMNQQVEGQDCNCPTDVYFDPVTRNIMFTGGIWSDSELLSSVMACELNVDERLLVLKPLPIGFWLGVTLCGESRDIYYITSARLT